MHVLITGAAGMLGCKLVAHLSANEAVKKFTLADIVMPKSLETFKGEVKTHAVDIADPSAATRLVAECPDVIFHLAAIVSGEAEMDFAKGNAINLDGTRHLLEAVRALAEKADYCPRFVFSSSIAVFGAPLPDIIDDDQRLTPLSSYGTQKAMGELMVADYTRKGYIDGISLRLPTITVRPGKPNKAASGFYSGIIREPLNGQEAILPVPDTVRHWFASPRTATHNLAHAGMVETATLPAHRALNLPGVSATIAEMIEALRRVAGEDATALIRRAPDDLVQRLVGGWPKAFAPKAAEKLGFIGEQNFDDIIQVYLEDDKGTG